MLNPERGAAAGGSGMIVPAGAPAQEGVSGTKRKGRMPCGLCPLVVSASVCSYLRPGRKRRGGVRPTGVGEPRPVRACRGASFRVGAPVCVERPAVPDPAEDEPPPKAGGAVLCAGRPLSVGLQPCLSAATWPLRVLPLRSPSGRCGPRSRIAPCRMGARPAAGVAERCPERMEKPSAAVCGERTGHAGGCIRNRNITYII